jgi:hypothetical protein
MAAIVVEDGTVVTGANSYVSTTELATYATDRGISITGTAAILLITAMDYIESLDFKGEPWTSTQPLIWPRINVIIDGWYQNVDDIPQQLKEAQMETALAIDAGNGPLIDLPRNVIREKVGEIEVQYAQGTSSLILVRKINAKLKKLLNSSGSIKVSKA